MSFNWVEVAGNILLFGLVFGMSATVDIENLKRQCKNVKAILCGVFLQFIVLPLMGFATVNLLRLDHALGITLLVVTSSPGGSYSNWWCSLFNADLALSVTMTAISTILSTIFLPLNLLVWSRFSYGDDIIGLLDWNSLFVALVIVISAIALGLFCSAKVHSHKFNMTANAVGNVTGIALVLFSTTMSNSGSADTKVWNRDWGFYVGVMLPCLLGLTIANGLSSLLQLDKPERVTVSVECCYQNVGIATSVALAMFEGDELAEAMGVPFFYGLMEAVILAIYCLIAWKGGWTRAPYNENVCKMLTTSYEVLYAEQQELNEIEVQISDSDDVQEEAKCNVLTLGYYFLEEPKGQKEPSGMVRNNNYGEPTSPTSEALMDKKKEKQEAKNGQFA